MRRRIFCYIVVVIVINCEIRNYNANTTFGKLVLCVRFKEEPKHCACLVAFCAIVKSIKILNYCQIYVYLFVCVGFSCVSIYV